MQIQIVNVSVSKPAGKKYNQADVVFTRDGRESKWRVMDFANPQVFKALEKAQEGEEFAITVGKNDKGYDTWTSATKVAEGSPTPRVVASTGSTGGTTKSSWETADERAARQRLIVRQSSLAQAIEYVKLRGPDDTGMITLGTITGIADQFTNWVFEEPSLAEMPNDI